MHPQLRHTMPSLFAIRNPVKNYPWGRVDYLCKNFGVGLESKGEPQAELWIGAHSSDPSSAMLHDGVEPLDEVIARNPRHFLGENCAHTFARNLPFLMKILSAAKPLSLQVHPDKQQAELGYARESAAGIPLNSPLRSYTDENHKPELMYALTPFRAMCGFREKADIFKNLESYGIDNHIPYLTQASANWEIKPLFASLMQLDDETKAIILAQATSQATHYTDETAQAILTLNKHYPGDIGVISPLLLHCLTLAPGEAIYLDAGTLHAYLEGSGVEIMANSDNVLRAGLTSKHIDLDELLKIGVFESRKPLLHTPKTVTQQGQETLYPTSVTDFLFSVIHNSDAAPYQTSTSCATLLLCLEGEVEIATQADASTLHLRKGQSCFIAAQTHYRIIGQATLAKATTNL